MSEEEVKKPKTIEELEADYKEMCRHLGNEFYAFWLNAYSLIDSMQKISVKAAELKREKKDGE